MSRVRKECSVDIAVQVIEDLITREEVTVGPVAIIGCEYRPERGVVRFFLSGEEELAAPQCGLAVYRGVLGSGGFMESP